MKYASQNVQPISQCIVISKSPVGLSQELSFVAPEPYPDATRILKTKQYNLIKNQTETHMLGPRQAVVKRYGVPLAGCMHNVRQIATGEKMRPKVTAFGT